MTDTAIIRGRRGLEIGGSECSREKCLGMNEMSRGRRADCAEKRHFEREVRCSGFAAEYEEAGVFEAEAWKEVTDP